jgi:hypothetical protein
MQDRISPRRLTVSPRARLLAAAALVNGVLVAACGGSSNSPNVASVSTTSSTTSSAVSSGAPTSPSSSSATTSRSNTTTLPKGSPTQLLVDWAGCMRSHGDPDQADPSVTSNKLIEIPWNPAIPGGYYGTNKGGRGNSGPGQYCRAYLDAAQAGLRGGRPLKAPDPAALVKFSACMRANGVPDFPDPTANGQLILPGGPQTAKNPTFQDASKLCVKKVGVLQGLGGGTPPPGTIELNGAGGFVQSSAAAAGG